jgi:cyanophycinase
LGVIAQAGGVFVGGGNTAVYHRLYAAGPVGALIRTRCAQGMAYGGVSAGMLIAGQVCPLDPEETGEPAVRLVEGLGLFAGVLLEPHFTTENRRAALLHYLALSGIEEGWGVDDDACLIARPGQELEWIGSPVIQVRKPG